LGNGTNYEAHYAVFVIIMLLLSVLDPNISLRNLDSWNLRIMHGTGPSLST